MKKINRLSVSKPKCGHWTGPKKKSKDASRSKKIEKKLRSNGGSSKRDPATGVALREEPGRRGKTRGKYNQVKEEKS